MKQSGNVFSSYDAQTRDSLQRYSLALGVMITFGPPLGRDDEAPQVMFMSGCLLNNADRRSFVDLANETQMEIVCLEFERNKAWKGPQNLTVLERTSTGFKIWARCSLWATDDGVCFLIRPKGQNFGFAYDGVHLRRITDVPTRNLTDGFARAKAEHRRCAELVPPGMLQPIAPSTVH